MGWYFYVVSRQTQIFNPGQESLYSIIKFCSPQVLRFKTNYMIAIIRLCPYLSHVSQNNLHSILNPFFFPKKPRANRFCTSTSYSTVWSQEASLTLMSMTNRIQNQFRRRACQGGAWMSIVLGAIPAITGLKEPGYHLKQLLRRSHWLRLNVSSYKLPSFLYKLHSYL